MKRFLRTATLAALAAFLTMPLFAQMGPGPGNGMGPRMERQAGHLLRCLRRADLSDSQQADIKTILEASRPTIQADAEAIKAARQKLNADYDAGADKSVIGADYIAVRAAVKKLHDDRDAVRDQILGKLTADQKAKVQDCLDSHRGGGMFRHGLED